MMKIRLDKSRPSSAVSGDRLPDDPHYRVSRWQDDLPFDVEGELVPDDGRKQPWDALNSEGKKIVHHPLWTDRMRVALARKLERMERAMSRSEEPEQPTAESPDEIKMAAAKEVNLEMWLRGEARYQSWAILMAACDRWKKRYADLGELVADAVMEKKVIPEEDLSPALRGYLDQVAPKVPKVA
jgi:hypothetical protein